MQRGERSARKGRFPEKWRKRASQVQNQLKMMLRQTVVLHRRTAKLFNDASKALHKHIHIFRLCLIHPHCVRCDFMASIRAFTPCRAQGPCVHKSFKTVSQLLENPYLYFCLANAGPPSQFACYPKAVRTGAPPKIKHRTPPPCVRPGSPPGLKFSLRPARPNGPFPFPGDGPRRTFAKQPLQRTLAIMERKRRSQSRNGAVAENHAHRCTLITVHASLHTHRNAAIALNRLRDTKRAQESPKRRPSSSIIATTRC